MDNIDDKVDALEAQRAALLDEKKLLAVLEREAFAEHAKLEEDQLMYVTRQKGSLIGAIV